MSRKFRGHIEKQNINNFINQTVQIVDEKENATTLEPDPSFRNEKLSWGISSREDAQVALSILMEITRDVHTTLTHYQEFTIAFIAPLDRNEPWEIEESVIQHWIEQQENTDA